MPELAEVEYFRRRWNPGLRQKVLTVLVHPPKRVYRGLSATTLARQIKGRSLLASWAHGKQMLFKFSGGHWLGVHLGMTGELRSESAAFTPGSHDHLVLRQARQSLIFADPRQFGRVRYHSGVRPPEWWTSLPPAVTAPDFTVERIQTFLRRRARSPIKAVLLQQECFPGIGNWMADEILWRLRLHPQTKAGRTVSLAHRLRQEIRRVTTGALRIVARNYSDPPPTWLFPHRWRDGGTCPRDGHTLRRAEVGGRTTAWCPYCQKLGRHNSA